MFIFVPFFVVDILCGVLDLESLLSLLGSGASTLFGGTEGGGGLGTSAKFQSLFLPVRSLGRESDSDS